MQQKIRSACLHYSRIGLYLIRHVIFERGLNPISKYPNACIFVLRIYTVRVHMPSITYEQFCHIVIGLYLCDSVNVA